MKLSQWNIRAGGETLERFVSDVSQDKMTGFELTVWAAIRGYRFYKDSWAPSFRDGFVCFPEHANEHGRHAVAVYKDGDSKRRTWALSKRILQVAFLAVRSTLWSVHIEQVGERWVIRSPIHLTCIRENDMSLPIVKCCRCCIAIQSSSAAILLEQVLVLSAWWWWYVSFMVVCLNTNFITIS